MAPVPLSWVSWRTARSPLSFPWEVVTTQAWVWDTSFSRPPRRPPLRTRQAAALGDLPQWVQTQAPAQTRSVLRSALQVVTRRGSVTSQSKSPNVSIENTSCLHEETNVKQTSNDKKRPYQNKPTETTMTTCDTRSDWRRTRKTGEVDLSVVEKVLHSLLTNCTYLLRFMVAAIQAKEGGGGALTYQRPYYWHVVA